MRMRAVGIAGVLVFAGAALAQAQSYDVRTLRAIGQGRALYLQNCAACHGALAGGNTNVPVGTDGVTCAPPDLTSIAARDGGFSPLHVKVHIEGQPSGKCQPGMPCWQQVFRANHDDAHALMQVYKLVKYLEWLQEHEQTPRVPD
jgi:hypothetical protein